MNTFYGTADLGAEEPLIMLPVNMSVSYYTWGSFHLSWAFSETSTKQAIMWFLGPRKHLPFFLLWVKQEAGNKTMHNG